MARPQVREVSRRLVAPPHGRARYPQSGPNCEDERLTGPALSTPHPDRSVG